MRRNFSPRRHPLGVEHLESRRLLSGLSYSLTTDQATYQVGQPIQFTFTETNTSTQPVGVGIGPVNSGFDVVHDGETVWASNTGPLPLFILFRLLQPGQSITLTATWNGIPNLAPPTTLTGGFTVTNQQEIAVSTSFQIQPQAGGPLATSITTDKPVYVLGETVDMTFTETNEGTTPIKVIAGSGTLDVDQNGNQVWVSAPATLVFNANLAWQTLAPGQTLTETADWNGASNLQPSVPLSGIFTLTDELAPMR